MCPSYSLTILLEVSSAAPKRPYCRGQHSPSPFAGVTAGQPQKGRAAVLAWRSDQATNTRRHHHRHQIHLPRLCHLPRTNNRPSFFPTDFSWLWTLEMKKKPTQSGACQTRRIKLSLHKDLSGPKKSTSVLVRDVLLCF